MTSRRPLASQLVRVLPKRALTQAAGALASAGVPRPLRQPLYRAYGRAVGANLDEAGAPLESFGTFNDFFTRPLAEGVRGWDAGSALASPCDGRIAASGVVRSGELLQAKGIAYGLSELLGDSTEPEAFDGGAFTTIYLSPADYHRMHAPADMDIESVRVQPGELWPVNDLSVPWVDGLFRRNERVVLRGRLRDGGRRVALVFVGATVVGKIRVSDPRVDCARGTEPRTYELEPVWRVSRGDEIGAFLLGSTVIVIVEPGARADQLAVPQGEAIRLGDPLFR